MNRQEGAKLSWWIPADDHGVSFYCQWSCPATAALPRSLVNGSLQLRSVRQAALFGRPPQVHLHRLPRTRSSISRLIDVHVGLRNIYRRVEARGACYQRQAELGSARRRRSSLQRSRRLRPGSDYLCPCLDHVHEFSERVLSRDLSEAQSQCQYDDANNWQLVSDWSEEVHLRMDSVCGWDVRSGIAGALGAQVRLSARRHAQARGRRRGQRNRHGSHQMIEIAIILASLINSLVSTHSFSLSSHTFNHKNDPYIQRPRLDMGWKTRYFK